MSDITTHEDIYSFEVARWLFLVLGTQLLTFIIFALFFRDSFKQIYCTELSIDYFFSSFGFFQDECVCSFLGLIPFFQFFTEFLLLKVKCQRIYFLISNSPSLHTCTITISVTIPNFHTRTHKYIYIYIYIHVHIYI